MLGLFDWLITQKKQKKKETNLFTPKIDRLFLFPFDLLKVFLSLGWWVKIGQGGEGGICHKFPVKYLFYVLVNIQILY